MGHGPLLIESRHSIVRQLPPRGHLALDPCRSSARRLRYRPQFESDGSLYFVATPDGIPNVYRLQNPSRGGSPVRVTNVVSGVAGITPMTPALSVSSNANTVVFTVFENDNYNIYATDTTGPQAVGALATGSRSSAVLPPGDRRPDEVVQLLESSVTGLPQPAEYPLEEYKP